MQALWQRVFEKPGDDAPRRVLADALMERGDPRGELISVQCRLAQRPEDEWGELELALQQREHALLDAHGDAWTSGWPLELRPVFARGFPLRQHARSGEFAERLSRALELHPTLTEVVLTDEDPARWREGFPRFVAAVPPHRLTRLTLPITFNPPDCEALSRLGVPSVVFGGGTLGDGVSHLCTGGFRELDFEFDVGMNEAGFAALAALPLTRLVNRGNVMGSLAPQWPELTRLTVDRVQWRAPPSFWSKLERLDLFETRLGRRGLQALLEAGHPRVTRLGLRGERIDAEVVPLFERWPKLEVLDLTGCAFGPGARAALEGSPVMKRLRCRLPR